MNLPLAPLIFSETFMARPWGGRRLATLYGKRPPSEDRVGEVWLLADHARCESRVVAGPCSGTPLDVLVQDHAHALLGRVPRLTAAGRFPLLLKLIDIADWLSLQVHPSDADAERLGEIDGGKTEMWYVLAAEQRAEILCGATGQNGRLPEGRAWIDCVERFTPIAEDVFFIPPGTVHALGPGLVIAEIQQTSDLTYRLFDWDRRSNGDRPLHLDKAAEVLRGHASQGPLDPLELAEGRELLCACEKFAVERMRVEHRLLRETRGDSFHITLNIGSHAVQVEAAGEAVRIQPGSAALVPGANGAFTIAGPGTVLDYYVPDLALDVVEPLSARGVSAEQIEALGCDYAEYRP